MNDETLIRVKADDREVLACRNYLNVQREQLRRADFFDFKYKRDMRSRLAEITKEFETGEVLEMRLPVPGFVCAASIEDSTLKRYFTEVNGFICEIDEAACRHCLRIETSSESAIVIREFPDRRFCASITLQFPNTLPDLTKNIRGDRPARPVFPGSFSTIIVDTNTCSVGFFPFEDPGYLTFATRWFYLFNLWLGVAQAAQYTEE